LFICCISRFQNFKIRISQKESAKIGNIWIGFAKTDIFQNKFFFKKSLAIKLFLGFRRKQAKYFSDFNKI